MPLQSVLTRLVAVRLSYGILSGMKWCRIAQKASPLEKLAPKFDISMFCEDSKKEPNHVYFCDTPISLTSYSTVTIWHQRRRRAFFDCRSNPPIVFLRTNFLSEGFGFWEVRVSFGAVGPGGWESEVEGMQEVEADKWAEASGKSWDWGLVSSYLEGRKGRRLHHCLTRSVLQ